VYERRAGAVPSLRTFVSQADFTPSKSLPKVFMYFQTLAMAPASCHRSARRPPKLPRTNHPPAVSTLSLLGFDLLMYQSLYMYVYIHIDVRVCACMHTTPYHTISLHCNTLHYTTLQRHYIIYISYIHTYRQTYIHSYIHTYRQTYIHTYIHTFIHTYRQTDIHTDRHTYIQSIHSIQTDIHA